jgi:hypothetical protein
MDDQAHTQMLRLFLEIPDPRMIGKVSHKLHDILVIAVCAILAGLDHWTEMEDYGKVNYDWFKSFLDLPYGIVQGVSIRSEVCPQFNQQAESIIRNYAAQALLLLLQRFFKVFNSLYIVYMSCWSSDGSSVNKIGLSCGRICFWLICPMSDQLRCKSCGSSVVIS